MNLPHPYGGPVLEPDVDLAELREVGALVLLAGMDDPRAAAQAQRVRTRYGARELVRRGQAPAPGPSAA